MKNGDCKHIALFGTFNENKYFLGDYKDSFDLVGFNANIIAHAPAGIAAFISQLKNKLYFIDPQTHAFQQPLKTIMRKRDGKWELKKSIASLVDYYGSIIKKCAGKTPITAGDIPDEAIGEICKNVLEFQLKKVQESAENLDVKEFLDFSQIELRPEFLIAPYFYLELDKVENELRDNIKFLTESKKIMNMEGIFSQKPLFAEIVIEKDILVDRGSISKVVEEYSKCSADGFLIWIDDFPEVSVSETILRRYKEFLSNLGHPGKPIIAMHGSYFSVALAGEKGLLTGVGHGIEYGEHRPVIPVGGGVPLAKFYFPKFHKRVNYNPDAQDTLLEMDWTKSRGVYIREVCSCNMCKEVIKNDVQNDFSKYGETKESKKNGQPYPTPEAMDKSRRHYLNTKINEYKKCASSPIAEIIDELKTSQSIAEKIKSHPFTHLVKWVNVLSG
jgi:hypothetical protein